MEPTIHFVTGLPRSGSTLLLDILAQNPHHAVTPTSGLVALVQGVKDFWPTVESFRAVGPEISGARVSAAIRGMCYGFYEQELAAGRIVFDKNRAWPKHIELMEQVLRGPVKVICPVRDLRSIVASIERLYQKNPLDISIFGQHSEAATLRGRTELLLNPRGLIGRALVATQDAFDRGLASNMLLVSYRDLTLSPTSTLATIHEFLYSPAYVYDFNAPPTGAATERDQSVYGLGSRLHTVSGPVHLPVSHPWLDVLPDALCADIAREQRKYPWLVQALKG